MIKSTLGAALCALLLTGCGQAAAKVDPAAIEKDLKAQELQWNADYAARDANALAGHYADDAALANPGAPIAIGPAAVRAAVDGYASDPNLKVDFASDRVQVAASGDLAYTRGHYSMSYTDPATKKVASDAGSYLTVWQKQADGSWKAVEDFITPGPAPKADKAE